MNRRFPRQSAGLSIAVALIGLWSAAAPVSAEPPPEEPEAYGNTPSELVPYSRSGEPYRRFFMTPLEFRGPGRDKPDPIDLRAVSIGLIAPLEGVTDDRAGRDMQRGVTLALEEANADGGYDGLPFVLVSKNDSALWGSSGNTLVELAFVDRVWALIGSIDSNTTHVALRAALKAELPMVNVGSADPTVTETGIPWIVRLTPDDRQTGYRLARRVFEEYGFKRVALFRSSDRYGRFGVKEFRDAARRLARPVPLEVQFVPGEEDFGPRLDRLTAADVEAVVLWTGDADGARIARQLRARGIDVPLFGTDRLSGPAFRELAGDAAEGVEVTSWLDPARDTESWRWFVERYRERFDREPGVFAAYGYDAARLVVQAVRHQGLNRIRIRDELMTLRRWEGVVGTIVLDETSNSVVSPQMTRIVGGRLVPAPDSVPRSHADPASAPEPPAQVGATTAPVEDLRVGIVADAGPAGAALIAGAERAANEWNATRATPRLQLFPVRPSRPWHDGASTLARLIFEQDLAVLIGSHDAAAAHAAAQVATAKRIPFLTVSPEDALTRVFDPWIFRGVPADGEQARAVLLWAFREASGRRVTLVVPEGRPGRERSAALEEACAALGVEAAWRVVVAADGGGDFAGSLTATDAVLLWLDPAPARVVVQRLRTLGFDGPILGSSRLDDPAFRIAAAGVALPQFAPQDPAAAHVLDRQGHALVRAVAAAAAAAGGAAGIRRQLAERSGPAPHFDDRGNRLGEIRVGAVCRGVVQTVNSPGSARSNCGDSS